MCLKHDICMIHSEVTSDLGGGRESQNILWELSAQTACWPHIMGYIFGITRPDDEHVTRRWWLVQFCHPPTHIAYWYGGFQSSISSYPAKKVYQFRIILAKKLKYNCPTGLGQWTQYTGTGFWSWAGFPEERQLHHHHHHQWGECTGT